MKNNTPEAQLTLPTNLQPLGLQHEMDFPEGSNIKAPRGLSFPLGPFSPVLPKLVFHYENQLNL